MHTTWEAYNAYGKSQKCMYDKSEKNSITFYISCM